MELRVREFFVLELGTMQHRAGGSSKGGGSFWSQAHLGAQRARLHEPRAWANERGRTTSQALTVSGEQSFGSTEIRTLAVSAHSHDLEASDSGYLAVWSDARASERADALIRSGDVFAALVSGSGEPLGSSFVVSQAPSAQSNPAVAFDGTNFTVLWTDARTTYAGDTTVPSVIFGARVSRQGSLLDADGFRVTSAAAWGPALAFDGTNYLVAYMRGDVDSDLLALRMRPDGSLVDGTELVVATGTLHQANPAVVFNGTNHLLVWQEDVGDAANVRAQRISPSGTFVDSRALTVSARPGRESEPQVASNGTDWLVVWNGEPNGWNAIRIGANGALLDAAPLDLGEDEAGAPPGVVWDGTSYRVGRYLYRTGTGAETRCFVRVLSTGAVLDAGNCMSATPTGGGRIVRLASNGNGTFAIYSPPFGGLNALSGSLLDTTGKPNTNPRELSRAGGIQHSAAVAGGASGFLTAWIEPKGYTDGTLLAARLDRSGAVLDPMPISLASGDVGSPALTAGAGRFLVVWEETVRQELHALVLGADGKLVTPNPTTIAMNAVAPSLAFDGSRFIAVWEDTDFFGGIRGRWLDVSGQPSGGPFSIVARNARAPAVAGGCGAALVAWKDQRINQTETFCYAARVMSDGSLPDGMGIPLGPFMLWDIGPSVATDGRDWLVTWADRSSAFERLIRGARVTQTGSVLESRRYGPVEWRELEQHAACCLGWTLVRRCVARPVQPERTQRRFRDVRASVGRPDATTRGGADFGDAELRIVAFSRERRAGCVHGYLPSARPRSVADHGSRSRAFDRKRRRAVSPDARLRATRRRQRGQRGGRLRGPGRRRRIR